MNKYPTEQEEAALMDVQKFPGESLADRAERLGVTRGGVHHLLVRCEDKGMAQRDGGKWSLTTQGRKWVRPTVRSYAR